MGKVYLSSKVVRSERLGWKREYNMCGEKYYKLYTVLCVQWKTADDGQRNCPKHV